MGLEKPSSTSMITVRGVDPADKSWLRREAKQRGISMEELVRRIIRERRQRDESSKRPSDVFKHYFGPEHGVDLPERGRYGYRPVEFDEDEA